MLALLATLLLASLAPPDTSLDDVTGRWEAIAETTVAFSVEGEPDSVTVRTFVEVLEIAPDTLVWTSVSATLPPRGSGQLSGIQETVPYYADGLTLHLPNATLRLRLDGENLVMTNVSEPSVPPQRYRRATATPLPEALVGVWGTTVWDPAGVGVDVVIRFRAEGTMQVMRDDPVPILTLGRYLLQPDTNTHFQEDETSIEREALLVLRVEVDGDRLTWETPQGEVVSLVRRPERAPRRTEGRDGE